MRRCFGLFQLVLLLAALFLFHGCNDDDCPVCPDGGATATIDNIWPHEDGNAWTYDLHNSFSSETDLVFYDNLEDVPVSAIDLDSLYAKLQIPLETDSTNVGLLRNEFDGLVTTESGVTAQNLTHTIFTDPYPDNLSSHGFKNSDAHNRLLIQIMQLRPDLRDKIVAQLRKNGVPETEWNKHPYEDLDPLFFLTGYAWEQNEEAIIGYGDIDTRESWRFLDADLSVGHSFVIQLLPSWTNDIFLHGKIMSRPTVTVGGQAIENCVECFYAIDFGISMGMDENGEITGYFNSEYYGSVTYAPEIGPIQGLERAAFIPSDLVPPGYHATIERGASFIGFVPGDESTMGGEK